MDKLWSSDILLTIAIDYNIDDCVLDLEDVHHFT